MKTIETLLGEMRAAVAADVRLVRRAGCGSADIHVARASAREAAENPHAAESATVAMLISLGEYHLLKKAGAVVEDPTLG